MNDTPLGRDGVFPRTVKFSLLGLLMVMLLLPFLVMVSTALKATPDVYTYPPQWLPAAPHPQNFLDVWGYVPLARYFTNSIIVAVGAMLLNGGVAIPAAYALSRLRFPGRRVILHLVVATQMFSPVVLLIAAFQMMTTLGLLNTYQALIFIDATVALPFTVWMMTAYFSTIPSEISEAAVLDGVGHVRMLWDHYLPLAVPGVATALIFSFILAWNEFLFALTFNNNPALRPLTTGIYAFVGRFEVQWNYLMAASLLSIVPVFVLFLMIQRRLVSGLTAGAVK